MMTKKFLLLVLIGSLFLVVTPVTAQESIFDETKTIENGKMWYITTNLIADQSYDFSLSVESGNAIDLLVMDKTNFDTYKDGFTAGETATYTYYSDYSALSIKTKTYSVTFDTDIKLCFVVENADYTENGASGGGSVDIKMSLVKSEAAPGFEFIIVLIALSGVVFLWKHKKR